MNEPICYVVMRNGHIMPPGIHMHRVNAEATAVKEEGEVVPLYSAPLPEARGAEEEVVDAEAQIKYMVNRFLGWRLPENFNPDAGISFKPTFNDHLPVPMKHEPTGTNLFDAQQAEAMVRYMIEGLPRHTHAPGEGWQPIEIAPKDGTHILLSWCGKTYEGWWLDNSKTSVPWAGWSVHSMVPRPAFSTQPNAWQPIPSPAAAPTAQEDEP